MIADLKEYLAETGELDLILNVRELKRERAFKKKEEQVQRVKREEQVLAAGLFLKRICRAFLTRRKLFIETLMLEKYTRIYFHRSAAGNSLCC